MIKMLACCCFIVGCCGFGGMKVREYGKRYEELTYIRYLLNTMLIELESHRATLGETCLALATKLREPYKDIFLGLYDLLEKERLETPHVYWERQISELSRQLNLKKEETRILREIIHIADATTMIMPLEVVRQSMVEWDKVIAAAEKVRNEKSRVTMCLSITTGLLLCILVI